MFNKKTANALMADILSALQPLATTRGLTIEGAGGSFDDGSLSVRIKVSAQTEDGTPVNFHNHATRIGLPGDCYGKTFTVAGHTYRVVGIRLRNRRYPVLATRSDDGKTYKLDVYTVSRSLAFGGDA